MHRPGWQYCIVAASGPSLTPEVAEQCRGYRVIAVNDAVFRMPFANVLYACDAKWWDVKNPVDFKGEKWSSHDLSPYTNNNKLACAEKYGLRLVDGEDAQGFSMKPGVIHYGGNSGFQAINLAMQFGARQLILVGFDMRKVNDQAHFFGEHPEGFAPYDFNMFINQFRQAKVSAGVRIVNATPDSALTCYPMMSLDNALEEWQCDLASTRTA